MILLYDADCATHQRKPSFVRFFRDYSVADLVFMFVSSLTTSYASFNSSSMLQASVCEELGRQPELMRDMAESGLNLENCEYWFETAIVGILGISFVLIALRVSLQTHSPLVSYL